MSLGPLHFRDDWLSLIRSTLREQGFLPEIFLPDIEAEFRWENYARRLVEPRTRAVHWSAQLKGRGAVPGLQELLAKAAQGANLNPHQSKAITTEDPMFNDWGIVHFHLGTAMDAVDTRFVERSDLLLFAKVTSDGFYAIEVGPHGSWADTSLVEVIHSNWPELLSRHRMHGIMPGANWTDEERLELRRAGITMMTVTNDGTVYAPPGGGYATDGWNRDYRGRRRPPTAVDTSYAVSARRRSIRSLELDVRNRAAYLERVIEMLVEYRGRCFLYALAHHSGEIVVRESYSGVVFPIDGRGAVAI